jgi:hypothetical protein
MYYYFRYYRKKAIIRNMIKGYLGTEELTYMMEEYIDINENISVENKILVLDTSNLELIKSEVSDMYCEFLESLSKAKWSISIIILPKSIIGSYQLKKFIKKSGINPVFVNNNKEAINIIKEFSRNKYQNCI